MGDLHVFAARFNPLRWKTPDNIYKEWVGHMLDSGVKLHVIECQPGDRPFVGDLPHVNHIGVRARTMAWSKECLLNIAISRVPEAQKIVWSDTDVFFRRPGWANEVSAALDIYEIGQPWDVAYDLGPHDEHMELHKSFASLFHAGQPVVPGGDKFWKFNGGPYDYAHTGYCWFANRRALDWTGGLFDLGGMGSGDHHMALALVDEVRKSVPGGTSPTYLAHLLRWQDRAARHINRNIGFVHNTIEHRFHGSKASRGYLSRWDMFVRHGFDPDTDLKRNTFGVLEWAGNKPELIREFDLYLRSRNEDANVI
jgi:hypothetical protein